MLLAHAALATPKEIVLEQDIQQAGVSRASVVASMAALNAVFSCGIGAIDETPKSFFAGLPIGGIFSLLAFRELLTHAGFPITSGSALASGLMGFGTQIPVSLSTYHLCRKGVEILRESLDSKIH